MALDAVELLFVAMPAVEQALSRPVADLNRSVLILAQKAIASALQFR
jgi:hypothetical protein